MLIDIVAIMVLAAGIANFIHWIMRGHRMTYLPGGKLGVAFEVVLLSQAVFAILMLARIISVGLFISVLGSYAIIDGVYSICHRQRLGRTTLAP